MEVKFGNCTTQIGRIFVYKHCFCYLNVQNIKEEDSLFHQPIVLWSAHEEHAWLSSVCVAVVLSEIVGQL